MNDAQLVLLAMRGERSAFETIVERYKSLVCAVTYGATGDYAASEDLAQETFVAAWQNLGRLEHPEKLRSWLCSVARHVSFSANRKRQREAEHAKLLQQQAQAAEQSGETPRDAATLREEQRLVWQTVEKIPDAYRVPLILYYREGQSVERVAAATGLSASAVKQRLLRGRRMLKEGMEALVENSLAGSRPGRKFTAGVLAALPSGVALNLPRARPVPAPTGTLLSPARELVAAWGAKQFALGAIAVLGVAGIILMGTGAGPMGPGAEEAAVIQAVNGAAALEEEPAARAEAVAAAAVAETPEPPCASAPEATVHQPESFVPRREIAPAGYPGTAAEPTAVDTVMGTVYAPNGSVLPAAKVWIARFGMQARDTRETVADETGRYALVVPPGQWMVSARQGQLGGESDIAPHGQVITNGEKKEIVANIPTEERCIVHGRVYDATTGQPIPHPRIWTASRVMITGDADGLYEIEGQDQASQTLAVLSPGYERKYVIYSTLLCEDFELDLHVAPAARITGRVVDLQGRGLAHAWVSFGGSGRGVLSAYYEVCDETGRFTCDGLPCGRRITLTAEQPRYVNTCGEPEPVEGQDMQRQTVLTPQEPGSAAEITFTLDPVQREEVRAIRQWPDDPPAGVVRGRLVTWDGQPVRNFQIITRSTPRDMGLPGPNAIEINEFYRGYSFTNDNGIFTLASPSFAPGAYLHLIATAPGYQDGVAEAVMAYAVADLRRVPETVFRLGMPQTLRVRITQAGSSGAPIRGANVVLQDITQDYMKQPFDWRQMESAMWRPVSATTDTSGWAVFEGIIHENGIVLATHPDYGRTRALWTGTPNRLELAMEREAALEGLSVDENGGVPPNLAVRLAWCPAPPYDYQDFERSSETWWDAAPGDGGHFQFDQLPAGYYLLKSMYWPNRKYDHTDAVQHEMEFFLESGQTLSVRLPQDSVQENPDAWLAAGGQAGADRELTERLAGGWENRYTLPDLGMQMHIVVLFHANGRYEQRLFSNGAENALEDFGYYRVSSGRLERITDRGGSLTETVDLDGDGFYLRMQGDPFPDHPARGPFRPIEDIEKSLRRGAFLLAPRAPVRAQKQAPAVAADSRSGFSGAAQ